MPHPRGPIGVLLALVSLTGHAEPVEVAFGDLHLLGEQMIPAGATDPVYLIVHGTWAHHGMEIVVALQELLAEEGIASLAPTLSLGHDRRTGFLSCAPDMVADYGSVAAELDRWIDFLTAQGWQDVVLLGHSRGAAQVARYQMDRGHPAVRRLVLLAPPSTPWEAVAVDYDARSEVPLRAVLDAASKASAAATVGPYRLLNCDSVVAPPSTFISHYAPATSTPIVVTRVAVPVDVILGSEDELSRWSEDDRARVRARPQVRLVEIEGAGHFFRDLYLDEVVEHLLERD